MCIGVMIVLEGYRDGGIVVEVGVEVPYAFSATILFYLNQISYIKISICFSFEHYDYNSKNILYIIYCSNNYQCLVYVCYIVAIQHKVRCWNTYYSNIISNK